MYVGHTTEAILLGDADHAVFTVELALTGREEKAGVVRVEVACWAEEVECNTVQLVLAEEGAILPGSLNVHAEQIAVHHLTFFAVLKTSGARVSDHGS